MDTGCPGCGGPVSVGILCARCASRVPVADGLIPGHVTARCPPAAARGWLVDGFGAPHPLPARAIVGRRRDAEIAVLHSSVSRDHAELRATDAGWELRDLSSRNGTRVDGATLPGAGLIADGARLRFGDVSFLLIARPLRLDDLALRSAATAHQKASRLVLRGAGREASIVRDGEGGLLLHRGEGDAAWSELALSALEAGLLDAIGARALAERGSPSRTRGCVTTRELSRILPFASESPTEETVRKLVHRLRARLDEIGAGDLLASEPGRGYYLGWELVTGEPGARDPG